MLADPEAQKPVAVRSGRVWTMAASVAVSMSLVCSAAACSGSADTSARISTAPSSASAPAGIRQRPGHWLCLDRRPRSAADYRVALNYHDERWQGGDGAVPVPLPDGRVVWLFGDTLTGSVSAGGKPVPGRWKLVHGTVLVQQGACFEPLARTADAPLTDFVPGKNARDVYWPGSGWAPTSGTLYVMLDRVRAPSGPLKSFEPIGNALAVVSLPDLRVRAVHAIPPPGSKRLLTWVARPLRSGAWVYLYAQHGFDHFVIRFPDRLVEWQRVENRQYWTGSRWSTDPAALRPMHVSKPPITGLAVIQTKKRYLAVAMESNDVAAWSAPAPSGPWTPIGTIAETADGGRGVRYGGLAVPALPGADPFVIWNVAAPEGGTVDESRIGTAPPLQPLR